jgi:hypothetical protein
MDLADNTVGARRERANCSYDGSVTDAHDHRDTCVRETPTIPPAAVHAISTNGGTGRGDGTHHVDPDDRARGSSGHDANNRATRSANVRH